MRIAWDDDDTDSSAEISLYYDIDNSGYNGILIASDIQEDGDGDNDQYLWDVSSISSGEYFIYAKITDAENVSRSYSVGTIRIDP